MPALPPQVKMIEHLIALGKTPMGWEEILFKTGAAAAYPRYS